MMARMPAYTRFKAKCPKCHGSNAATAWHEGGTIGEKTSRGRNWPCQFRVRGEHLCRECRTCGHAWAEALAYDEGTRAGSPEAAPCTGQAREDLEREAVAAFDGLAAAIGACSIGPSPEECGRVALLLTGQAADRVRLGEYVVLSHAHFSALVRVAAKKGAQDELAG